MDINTGLDLHKLGYLENVLLPPTGEVRFVEDSLALLDPEVRDLVRKEYLKGATEGSAGLDLRYVGVEPITLEPGHTLTVNTGLSIHLKDPSLVGMVYPRSGLGRKGLVLGNLTGVIDSDYTGEILLVLWNRNQPSQVGGPLGSITVEPGERVAQLLIQPRIQPNFQVVEQFTETTERGSGGFGSSGTK